MKKRFFIKLFHTIFFILVGMGIMYLYMQKQTDPMDQIQKLMSQNDVDPDEAICIYLKKNPDLTDSQKGDLFLNAINNFTLSEGVFSSMVEMAEINISASGTDKPDSHFETVCLTTCNLMLNSSCESPLFFLNVFKLSFNIIYFLLSSNSVYYKTPVATSNAF